MKRPVTAATLAAAPSPIARRLVLATALLIGLAMALAPRSSSVHAQESNAAPATASKPQPAAKTVTITDGRGGAAKIEVRDASDPAAKPAAGEPSDAVESPPSGSGGRSVAVGKRARIQIDGLGTDHEFDSFGAFAHDEPAIAAMVVLIVSVVFLAPVLAIGLVLWYRMRKARMLNETMLKLAEKGIVAPADALEALAGGKQATALAAAAAPLYEQARQVRRRAAWSDLRKGVITGGVGLALTLYSIFDDRSPNGLGLVLLFVGIGFVVLWWFEERHLAPANGGAADAGTPGRAPGGPPPSA